MMILKLQASLTRSEIMNYYAPLAHHCRRSMSTGADVIKTIHSN